MEQLQNQREVTITTRSSIGMGVGNFALYRSFISFTTNTTSKTTRDVTRSAMFVFVIWLKTLSRVCKTRKKKSSALEIVVLCHSSTILSRRACIWIALRVLAVGIYSLGHDVVCQPRWMCMCIIQITKELAKSPLRWLLTLSSCPPPEAGPEQQARVQ